MPKQLHKVNTDQQLQLSNGGATSFNLISATVQQLLAWISEKMIGAANEPLSRSFVEATAEQLLAQQRGKAR